MAAEKQRKFWEFHDKVFASQQQVNLDAYKRYARELKLDVARLERDLADLESKKRIDAELGRLNPPVPAGAPAG